MVQPHLPSGKAIGQQLQAMERSNPPNPSTLRKTSHWATPKAGAQSLALEDNKLFHIKEDGVNLYKPALGEGARTRENSYVRTEEGTGVVPRGGPCTIGEAGEGIFKIILFTDNPPPTEPPSTCRQVLSEWGHTWMWESLNLAGDGENEAGAWLKEATEENTLVAVTDGSYMKELYPDMNS